MMIANAAGVISAPPNPCAARAPIKTPAVEAKPLTSDAVVNTAKPVSRTRRRDSRSAIRPPSSSPPPDINRYAVTNHCRVMAPRGPAGVSRGASARAITATARPSTATSTEVPPAGRPRPAPPVARPPGPHLPRSAAGGCRPALAAPRRWRSAPCPGTLRKPVAASWARMPPGSTPTGCCRRRPHRELRLDRLAAARPGLAVRARGPGSVAVSPEALSPWPKLRA